jgi:hypothetical protein
MNTEGWNSTMGPAALANVKLLRGDWENYWWDLVQLSAEPDKSTSRTAPNRPTVAKWRG